MVRTSKLLEGSSLQANICPSASRVSQCPPGSQNLGAGLDSDNYVLLKIWYSDTLYIFSLVRVTCAALPAPFRDSYQFTTENTGISTNSYH